MRVLMLDDDPAILQSSSLLLASLLPAAHADTRTDRRLEESRKVFESFTNMTEQSIPSWLLDLTSAALAENGTLDNYSGHVEDSGEGRWTVNAAVDEAVPAEVLTAALFARFRSRQQHTFAEKILSAMRAGFGGHKEPHKPDPKR